MCWARITWSVVAQVILCAHAREQLQPQQKIHASTHVDLTITENISFGKKRKKQRTERKETRTSKHDSSRAQRQKMREGGTLTYPVTILARKKIENKNRK
jgi:ABC-type uncharacterized transport system ATPase component